MKYIKDKKDIKLKNTVVCLGNFDGIHLGHQKLINKTIEVAKKEKLSSVVFSFYPHPKKIIFSEDIKSLLTSSEKALVLQKLDLDFYVEYPFDKEFSLISAKDFIKKVVLEQLGCKILIVGERYSFGKNKEGNINSLEELCDIYNIKLIKVPHLKTPEKDKISSSYIRRLIMENNFLEAEKLMGRPFFVKGTVIPGKQIGRTLEFPTINLVVDYEKLLPKNGVYITKTIYKNEIKNSITNIGRNPTVNEKTKPRKTVETFIFDFSKDIYEEEVIVSFYKNIRKEIKFENIEVLKNQILMDVETAKKYFDS